ncbi:hypothetical protein BRADI_3g35165v3 [Brachypodium distachyon]|uniref:Uncharacterized protein n=1 Tax=Brachypodium distachyon TaxID=15368 RepID=A0A0Q3FET6_BRADI|nr:hypothetical protein BRADI_3g35165v3 [Brachypodium distachyon]
MKFSPPSALSNHALTFRSPTVACCLLFFAGSCLLSHVYGRPIYLRSVNPHCCAAYLNPTICHPPRSLLRKFTSSDSTLLKSPAQIQVKERSLAHLRNLRRCHLF